MLVGRTWRRRCSAASGPRPPWGELIASAQAVMGLFRDDLSGDLARLYEEQTALPLIAAARSWMRPLSRPPACRLNTDATLPWRAPLLSACTAISCRRRR